ncbi:hypothetical protein BKA67DRAFT_135501 [Truncatella angustata]|uniref:Enoyl reductase (ER) domain-containing protein n=1 Tax=Truncatella angustata TaxID=152316 RepID=A0A9P8RF63_9PEZI|nr:uncharacterized protein BKA67DRAFT_135501 [Truncatella angustata]KAH6643467.1 hypothetical protein BKA67DRAFT_135501 [Truncatella angustata]KAH8202313.1 hypothetical protein TruAng_003485 [Truncatella angustata]
MKALRFHGKRDIRLEQIDEPVVQPGWVKIKPAYVGICGTDLHEYLGGNNLIPKPGHPHVITKETSPVTLGHEFSGIVEEVAGDITDLCPGDRVCIQPTIYCNECYSCQRNLHNACTRNGFIGLSGWGGGLAEHTVVPRSAVWKLPAKVSLEYGALVEPLAVGYHAVTIAPIAHPIHPDTPILVLGGGPIGLSVIQAIRAQSDSSQTSPLIIVSEPSITRQQFARNFGARHVINPLEKDLVAEVMRLTNNRGCDVVLDAAGVQSGLDEAMRCLRAGGTVVNIAVWEKRATLEMNSLTFRERAYMGCATYSNEDFGHVLRAIDAGKIKPGSMITKMIGIEDVENEGFRALIEEKDTQVKILVDMGVVRRRDSAVVMSSPPPPTPAIVISGEPIE